jgi:hypothetical protein
MREHAKGHASAARTRDHGDVAHTPGKATLDEHRAAGASSSLFDSYEWEDLTAQEKPAAQVDIGDVNKIEQAAAGSGGGGAADDDDALASDAQPEARAKHGDHGNPADHAKHHGGHDAGGGIHIITRAGLRHLRHAGPAGRHAAQVLYNNPNAYIVLKEGQTIPRGWKCKATILFPSYTELEAAHRGGRIPRGTDAVVYDNEHWAQTPHYEKTNAVHYAKLFGELAHKLGLVYIAAPTQKWFPADARFADIIDLQLQGREVHTAAYQHAVKHDVRLAHHLNPDIKVVGQISSNRNHLDPDHSGNIEHGIHNAEHDVLDNAPYLDGFWGYLYQQNHRSVRAGQKILKDLSHAEEHGAKI